ncbi:MAG: hypothetical protein O2931_10100 [Planctomycetota bacterium]|nr:hypothetical protein [Planctomycetota bacterium]MDA1179133.1 hypothetical protein [Planctomycetota bacterium]
MKISRNFLFALVLGAAFGLPYVLTDNDLFQSARGMWDSLWKPSAAAQTGRRQDTLVTKSDRPELASQGSNSVEKTVNRLREIAARTVPRDNPLLAEMAGPPVNHPAELFRFDVQPEWVGTHWSRVTNLPVTDGLEEYRVPVTTGTAPHDVVGSMSFCFDETRQVQRVSFTGTTHEPGTLVDALSRHYGLQPQPSNNGRLYTSSGAKAAENAIWVNLASRGGVQNALPVYRVQVELNRPGHRLGPSDWLKELLQRNTPTQPNALTPLEEAKESSPRRSSKDRVSS